MTITGCPRCKGGELEPERWPGRAALLGRKAVRCKECGRSRITSSTPRREDLLWEVERLEDLLKKLPSPRQWRASPEVRRFLDEQMGARRAKLGLQLTLLRRGIEGPSRAPLEQQVAGLKKVRKHLEAAQLLTQPPRKGCWDEERVLDVAQEAARLGGSQRYEVHVGLEQLKVLSALEWSPEGRRPHIRVHLHEGDGDLVAVAREGGEILLCRHLPELSWALSPEEAEVYDTLRRDGVAALAARDVARWV